MPELYERVLLNRDFPEHNLRKGDIGIFIDTVAHPLGGEEGYVIEFFNDIEESVNTIVVPDSTVESSSNKKFLNQEGNLQTNKLEQLIK